MYLDLAKCKNALWKMQECTLGNAQLKCVMKIVELDFNFCEWSSNFKRKLIMKMNYCRQISLRCKFIYCKMYFDFHYEKKCTLVFHFAVPDRNPRRFLREGATSIISILKLWKAVKTYYKNDTSLLFLNIPVL